MPAPSLIRQLLNLSGIRAGLPSYANLLAENSDDPPPTDARGSLHEYLQHMCEQLVGELGVYNLWIALVENGRTTVATSSFRHGFSALKSRMMEGYCPHCLNEVMARPGVVVMEDPSRECGDCPLAASYHGRMGLAVRIENRSRVIGILCASVPDMMGGDEALRSQMAKAAAEIGVQVSAILEHEEWMRTEATVHSIYRAAPVGIGLILDGLIREANDTLCEMTGLPRERLLGMPFDGLFVAEVEAERVGRWITEVIRKQPNATVETHWLRGDSRVISVRLGVTPLDLADPDKGVTFAALDITLQLEAARELRESRRLLSSLMDSLPGMAYRCRLDRAWTMEFISNGCRDLTGYEVKDLLGGSTVTYADLIHPDDRERVFTEVSRAAPAGPFTLEYRIRRADGEERWVWERGRVVSGASMADAMVEGFIIDITERKQVYDRVMTIKNNASLSAMAGGLAHDFNNLLSVIMGNAELGLRLAGEQPELRTCLEEMIRHGERASALCRQLLSFCGNRIAGCRVDVCELVTESVPVMQGVAGPGVTLRVACESEVPPIEADPAALRQMLLQLVANAAESYEGRPGEVEVVAGGEVFPGDKLVHALPLDLRPTGAFAWIRVVDRGCGMSDEVRRRMFDPFFSTKFTGRGMGLAATLGVVRSHAGFLTVDSAPGAGTTLCVYLPAVEDEDVDKPARRKETPPVRSVLLVDDEAGLRELTERMLAKEGIDTIAAEDGRQAVDLYRDQWREIDMVLMDLTMPGMDGIEAALAMREINPGVRIILTTGYSEEDITSRLAPENLEGILLKPYSRHDLIKLLKPQKP